MADPGSPMPMVTRLRSREPVAEGTMAFHFDRPSGYDFRAGQFLELTLISPPETDAEGDTRAFSIASPPSAQELVIATRLRDTAFKRVLRDLPIGSELRLAGPFGDLTLHQDTKRPAVILTGGIGITPFRSIVHRAEDEKLAHRIYLFYVNRRPEDAAFLEELQAVATRHRNLRFIPTMDHMELSNRPWKGETGPINRELLARHIEPGGGAPVHYIAGPPGMVAGLRKMLVDGGTNEDDIRTEEFSGY